MVFRQGVLKEEKIKFLIAVIGVMIPYATIAIISLVRHEKLDEAAMFLLIIFLPIFVLTVLFASVYLEWFYIYDDRIEARFVFGRKNVVFFDSVLFVEQTEIDLITKGMRKTFYIFNDGRKNNNSFLNLNSCYNNKKFNLRICKTSELENFINTKQLSIQDSA